MVLDFLPVHDSWQSLLEPVSGELERILTHIENEKIAPKKDLIFKALDIDLELVRVVIIGQDPYPTSGNAMGLAFSIPANVEKIPASLRNIFTELESDLGISIPSAGDLSQWASQGVLLLNRVLTTVIGQTGAHHHLGWQSITNHIAHELGKRDVIAILWGKEAQELASYFSYVIKSPHPSPLSAYRGFFGSRPFSRANAMLVKLGKKPIDWTP